MTRSPHIANLCPPQKTLLSYEQGELKESDAGDLERHLSQCEGCRTRLEQVRATDPDTQLIRRVFQFTRTQTAENGGPSPTPLLTSSDGSPGTASDQSAVAPDYERITLCGEGSFGAVWAVRDRAGVHRAMKIIELDRLARAGVECNELEALKTYCRKVERHPHLITVHHIGMSGGCLYYTMELADDWRTKTVVRDKLPGEYRAFTLRTLMDAQPVPFDASVEIVRRVLKGLSRLHELDLMHRDVKPSNIVFINRNPKLADIGIIAGLQAPGRSIGTPRYMPPDRASDKTADVYAAGKVLDELVHARPASKSGELPDPDRSQWDAERIDAVIQRAGAGAAADRYPSAAAMLEDLEACRVIETDSLLDGLEWPVPAAGSSPRKVVLQLAFAFVYRIPWIVGLIALLYALSLLRH